MGRHALTEEERKRRRREYMQTYRARKGKVVGVGKGGANKKGRDNPQYKTGMGEFVRLRDGMRKTITECERCGKDLKDASRFEWCVHHIDHDRTNNVRENLEMLCKRCHQLEHECHKALKLI
jgi:ribosomal protein L13E